MREVSASTNSKDLKSFLCSVLYSARFIKDLMTIAEPLWKLTRADAKWRWTHLEQAAFETIKASITSTGTSFFNKDWFTEIIEDASPVGLSAVLTQIVPLDEDHRTVVSYASRLLTDVERRYSQCDKEALAVV